MKNRVVVIAEAGVNHNGSLALAIKLIDEAVNAGADIVKFQTFKAERLVTEKAEKAGYQIENTGNNETQFQMLKKLELTEDMHLELINYCRQKEIMFLSTPFDELSADYLCDKVDIFKIPSGEITNFPFLKHIAKLKKPIILSTGMSNLEEVHEAVNVIRKEWGIVGFDLKKEFLFSRFSLNSLTLLHCTTSYPTPFDQANLLAMSLLAEEFNIDVGYSDHTSGILAATVATSLGAKVVEKHFTLDCSMEGPDHIASLEPNQLKDMIAAVRNVSILLGEKVKEPREIEKVNIAVIRKSIFFNKSLVKGHVVKIGDLIVKRPGNGLHSRFFDELLGKTLNVAVEKDQMVSFAVFDD